MAESYLRIKNDPNQLEFIIIDDILFTEPYTGPTEASGSVIWLQVEDGPGLTELNSAPSSVSAQATSSWPDNEIMVYSDKICYGSPSTEEICSDRASGKTNYIKIDFDNDTLGIYQSN